MSLPYRSFLMASALVAGSAAAALGQAQSTTVKDNSMLKPPAGYRVAVIEWEDLECPACAHAFPIIQSATDKLKVPWIQYDYPLGAIHPWSKEAAIYARWFDTHSREIGNQYRAKTFAAQNFIHPGNLRGFTENFAKDHNLQLPFVVDPQGKLEALVMADHALGDKVGLNHTPTIFIVTDGKHFAPYTEILDSEQIYTKLQAAVTAEGGAQEAKPAARTTSHKSAK